MKPRAYTTTLNSHAREYNPIPPGVISTLHAPPPYTACRRPQPSFHPLHPPTIPHQICPYIQSTTHNSQHHPLYRTTYFTYYAHPQNQVLTTPPPPPHKIQLGRGSTRRGRGYGRGRERRWSERVPKIPNINFQTWPKNSDRNGERPPKHQQYPNRGMQKDEKNKHKTKPLQRDEESTTVMIKNIPYDCPRKELISMLDDFCLLENQKASNEGTSGEEDELTHYAYDFLYLPIDFRTKKSRGFAFVNFTSSKAVWKFFDSFHLKKWERSPKWPKKIEIVRANIQGKSDLVKHFSGSVFDCGTDEFLPVWFNAARDGSGQPVEVTVVGNRLPGGRRVWRYNH